MMTGCRHVAAAAAATVLCLSGVECFVAQTSALLGCAAPRTRTSIHSSMQRCSERTVTMMEATRGDRGLDRRDALSGAWKAALSLATLGAVAGAPAGASAGILPQGLSDALFPPDVVVEVDVGVVDKEITFDEFNRLLLKGEVKTCEFFGSNFDKAVVQLKDGTKALIGEGYPEERAFSDDSPMKVVGLLRNAGVPYTTQFKIKAYTKPKSYKSTETLEAESRQRSEDEAIERLMSE